MNCEQMLELLSARLDGELNQTEEQAVQAHLAQCPECRALWEQISALQFSLDDLETIPAPENFAQGVITRVRQESRRPKVIPLWKRRQVGALMSVAACAVLCVGLLRFGGSGKSEAPMMAAIPEAAMIEAETAMPESAAYEAPAAAAQEPTVFHQKSAEYGTADEMEPAMPEAAAEEAPAEPMAPDLSAVSSNTGNRRQVLKLEELPEGAEKLLADVLWTDEGGKRSCFITEVQAWKLSDLAQAQGLLVLTGEEELQDHPAETEELWLLILETEE